MKNTFAYQIYCSFFDNIICSKIEQLASKVISDHETPIGGKLPDYEGTPYTNIKFYNQAINYIPELALLMEDCNLKILIPPSMGFVPPNKYMGIHIDEYNCKCKILLPVLPKEPTSLNFYKNYNSDAAFSIPTVSNIPIIFDCDKPHGGITTGQDWRVNLQMKFKEPFEEVVEMVKNNTLFRTIDTNLIY